MKIILTFFLGLLCSIGAGAQDVSAPPEESSSLGLFWGYAQLSRQDLIFSPFVHRGGGPLHLGLFFQHDKGRRRHRVDLAFTSLEASFTDPFNYTLPAEGEVKTTYPHYFTLVDLDYGLTWKLGAGKQGKLTPYAGGMLSNTVNAMDYWFGRVSHFGYFAAFSLGARLGADWRFHSRHTLNAKLDLPLVSWVARSPYLVNDDEFIENNFSHQGFTTFFAYLADGSVNTLDKLQRVNFDLHYQFDLSPRWGLQAGYGLRFIRHTTPLELISILNQFEAGINVKF